MTFYESEIQRIQKIVYHNQYQVDLVIKTRKFIHDNLEKELDLDQLSKASFVSKFHLLRLFRQYYGQTPKQYIIEKRIEKSKVLLSEGYAVTETCYAVGFDSPCSFSTLFKSKTGKRPSSFQQ